MKNTKFEAFSAVNAETTQSFQAAVKAVVLGVFVIALLIIAPVGMNMNMSMKAEAGTSSGSYAGMDSYYPSYDDYTLTPDYSYGYEYIAPVYSNYTDYSYPSYSSYSTPSYSYSTPSYGYSNYSYSQPSSNYQSYSYPTYTYSATPSSSNNSNNNTNNNTNTSSSNSSATASATANASASVNNSINISINSGSTGTNYQTALTGYCTISPTNPAINQDVTFVASASGGSGSYQYSWTGSDNISSFSQSFTGRFTTTGYKYATVTIRSGSEVITKTCSVTVDGGNYNGYLDGSCYASPSTANVGDNVTWVANGTGGNGSYSYYWSGADGLSGYGSSINKTYSYTGSKYATVTITSNGQSVTRTCNTNINQYNNYNYNNSTVYCVANPTSGNVGDAITWTAYVQGGSYYGGYTGSYYGSNQYTYSWTGTDGLSYGNSYQIQQRYNTPGTKTATVTVYTQNGQTVSATCNAVIGGSSIVNGNPVSGVYLSEVPDTGIELGLKGYLYILSILILSGFVGFMVVRQRKVNEALSEKRRLDQFKMENMGK